MNRKSLERKYKQIEQKVLARQLKDALDLLKELVISSRRGEYVTQYENLEDTYKKLLLYAIEGTEDPERENIYQHMLISVIELADVSLQQAYMNESTLYVYKLKKNIEFESRQVKEDALKKIEDLVFDDELSEVLQTSIDKGLDKLSVYHKHHDVLLRIFNLIWLTDKFKDSDEQMVHSIWDAKHFNWYERAIVISAITISLVRCFDTKKIEILIRYISDENKVISQRALVGLFIALHIYSERIINFYPHLVEKIKDLANFPDMEMHIGLISIQLFKSKETERITKKLQDEILPEMVKYQPMLRDKLDLDNILSKDFSDEKNPDWERVFEDAPDLLDKLQEISKLQMEGADVFMSTFARLKGFPFFADIINWFRPFYKDNIEIKDQLASESDHLDIDLFMEGLEDSFFMCNSDKYSFCLNIPQMPDLQKSMMIDMFNAEIESIREIQADDDILNKPAKTKSIYSQYIHDLYRFYKVHPLRYEFTDLFDIKFDFFNSRPLQLLIKDSDTIRNMGEYLFEINDFESAIDAFILVNKQGDNSMEIFEKIGYCYQKLKKYQEALDYYKRAELFEANRAWNLKKIALCYRYIKDYSESLRYYLEAEKLEPDNLYIQIYIGHSYLDLKEYEKALNYYFKVKVLAEENKKVLRPIAWCSFVLGKFETAKNYYEKLIVDQANKFDFMNLGHVEWCLGNLSATIKNYKLSINHSDNNLKSFIVSFEEDKEILLKYGIDQEEIPLLIDFLKYQL